MAVIGQAEILLTANTASFTTEMDRARSISQRTARQIQRDQENQARERLQIERQYASEHRRVEIDLANELQRIRAAGFNTADQERYLAQARANAQAQVNALAEQERATNSYVDKAKAAYGYVAAAVGVAAAAIGALIQNQIQATSELTKTAYVANTTVSNIQKYVVAARGMGIETEKLGDIFKDTQDKVGDFLSTGGGEMKDFFENVAPLVGVTAKEFRNLSGPDALQLYFDSLQKANLSQNEMVFYMEAIADEASALIPYLKDGGAGFKLWEEAARNAGATMDEKTIRATQELKTSTELLNLSVQGVKNQIASAFMPILRDLATELVKDATFKDKARIAGEALAKSFKILAMTGVGVVAIVTAIGKGIGGLMASMAQLGRVTEGVDFTSPFAMFQLGKNVFYDIPAAQIDILKNAVIDIGDTISNANKTMDWINNLGSNASGSTLVSQMTDLTIQSEKLRHATGKTGAQLQEEAKAKEANAKETEKLAKANAKLIEQGKYAPIQVNSTVLAHAQKYNYSELEKRHGLPAGLLSAISMQESRGNPNATSYVGAKGEFQFMPATAKRFGIAGQERNTPLAAEAAAKYLSQHLRMFGDLDKAIAAYNAGEGNVQKVKWDTIMSNRFAKGQTFDYVKKVRGYLSFMNGGKSINSGYDVAGAIENEAEYARKQAEMRLQIEREQSDGLLKLQYAYEAEVNKIKDAGFDEKRKTELLKNAEEEYGFDVEAYKATQQQKLDVFTEFKKSERQIIEDDAYYQATQIAADETKTRQQRKDEIEALRQQRDYKLKQLDFTEAKEYQSANAIHQTKVENIKAEAALQRQELALNLKIDANLRKAKLDAINAQEQETLRQARKDFENELSSITDYSKSEIQRIRDDFAQKLNVVDNRTDIDASQKSDLRNALAGAQNEAIRIARQPHVDAFNGLNAEMSGNTELYQLHQQHESRLKIVKDALKEEVIEKEQAAKAMMVIDQNYANQQQAILVGGYQQNFGLMASIVGKFGGQQSKAYQVLANIEKGYAIHKAWLNSKTAILDAYAKEPGSVWAKMGAAAKAAMETGVMTAAIEAIQIKGFATGGYTGDIPTNAVAGLVHGGEYVFDAEATKAIGTKNLDSIRKGENVGSTTVNVNVTINSDGSSSVESQQQLGKSLGDAVNAAVQKALIKERRQGGLLAGAR